MCSSELLLGGACWWQGWVEGSLLSSPGSARSLSSLSCTSLKARGAMVSAEAGRGGQRGHRLFFYGGGCQCGRLVALEHNLSA